MKNNKFDAFLYIIMLVILLAAVWWLNAFFPQEKIVHPSGYIEGMELEEYLRLERMIW